jgi:hypothetical protein
VGDDVCHMSTYDSYKVRCPFFRDITKNTLRCEGIISETITNNFALRSKNREHQLKYCQTDYEECPLYKILIKKYDE